MPSWIDHHLRLVKAQLEDFEINLKGIPFENFKSYIDEYFPFEAWVEQTAPDIATVRTHAEGYSQLINLAKHYYDIDSHSPDKYYQKYFPNPEPTS